MVDGEVAEQGSIDSGRTGKHRWTLRLAEQESIDGGLEWPNRKDGDLTGKCRRMLGVAEQGSKKLLK